MRLRVVLACLATAALVAPLAWMWQSSLVPDTFSIMEMGYVDAGGGPVSSSAGHDHAGHSHTPGELLSEAALAGGPGDPDDTEVAGGAAGRAPGDPPPVAVPDLVADPAREPDVVVDLVAAEETFTLASGREVAGFTLNGGSPGPTIEARQGDLVEVRLRNDSVAEGMTLHWHGVDVPNAEDGVAGVTQDAVLPGEDHVYRFVAEDAGTFWYHSHQVSHAQVKGGLLGALVVRPVGPGASGGFTRDVLALTHLYDGTRTLNGQEGELASRAEVGEQVRVRVINTDNGPIEVWTGTPYRVVAVDGTAVVEPTEVSGPAVTVTAGGRVDLGLEVPEGGARVHVGSRATSLVVGPYGSDPATVEQPADEVDLLSYGTAAPTGLDVADPDRTFDYSIGRRPGFVDGRPGLWWTINGHLYPDVPMYVVREGDVVVMRIDNHSGDVHPMHLHGHHALVLSRDGVPATGSPWWVDSLNVRDGEEFEIAFVADNPGVWMDHCHNLEHAAEGLVAHLMYDGVTTPYLIGGRHHNEPE